MGRLFIRPREGRFAFPDVLSWLGNHLYISECSTMETDYEGISDDELVALVSSLEKSEPKKVGLPSISTESKSSTVSSHW